MVLGFEVVDLFGGFLGQDLFLFVWDLGEFVQVADEPFQLGDLLIFREYSVLLAFVLVGGDF